MASKLIRLSDHEAENQFEISLREAFHQQEPKFKPPLKLVIPSPSEYLNLNMAIAHGVLCDPHQARTYLKYLHAVVDDGYELFVKLLVQIVDELYSKLVETARRQLIWVASVVVDVAGVGFQNLLVSLLRQIVSGDLSDWNLWLSLEMVNFFLAKWALLVNEQPDAVASALYVYLGLLSDHCRLANGSKFRDLKQKEIEFCLKTLYEEFGLCMKLGRDLVRLLRGLVHIPEFKAFWKTLLLKPSLLKVPEFSDISDLYRLGTSSRYFLLRITPEMEAQLRFLLTSVKCGNQRRHQVWFANKFLFSPERETLICDIVRFICCSHHPSNEIIQSNIVPRWAVIGWLLSLCTKKYVEANAKLALFYDWLFFDEKVDMVMNIEPAMLLLVNSISRYTHMAQSLLEFLILLVENFDVDRRSFIHTGVSSAFRFLVQKGVVRTLDVLTQCEALYPFKEKLNMITMKPSPQIPLDHVRLAAEKQLGVSGMVSTVSGDLEASIQSMVLGLGEILKKEKELGLANLERILLLFADLDSQGKTGDLSPEVLASKIINELETCKYKLFSRIESLPDSFEADDEIQSPTATMIRTYMYSRNQNIKEMLLFLSKNACPVGARLLSYALRLAYEARKAVNVVTRDIPSGPSGYQITPFLKLHVDSYLSFKVTNADSKADRDLVLELVGHAFSSYRSILIHSKNSETPFSFAKLVSSDLLHCSEWKRKRFHILFRSIFLFLSDMSVGEEDIIRLLVSQVDDSQLLRIQFDTRLRRYSIFGDDIQILTKLVRRSINWDYNEQHRLWSLIRSELSVSNFPVEKLLFGVFCSGDLDPKKSSLLVGGLLELCSCCFPTKELVGAILLLPDDKFPDFSAAVLGGWVSGNSRALLNGVTVFLDRFGRKNGSVPADLGAANFNKAAFRFLLSYMESQGGDWIKSLDGNSLQFLSDIKARCGDSMLLQKVS